MPKRTNGGSPKKDPPIIDGPTPPLLSEKLIAQLQGAVRAAQRKQMPAPTDESERRAAEKDL
jgi:hypothetical protein